jgi:hypothetical protein
LGLAQLVRLLVCNLSTQDRFLLLAGVSISAHLFFLNELTELPLLASMPTKFIKNIATKREKAKVNLLKISVLNFRIFYSNMHNSVPISHSGTDKSFQRNEKNLSKLDKEHDEKKMRLERLNHILFLLTTRNRKASSHLGLI